MIVKCSYCSKYAQKFSMRTRGSYTETTAYCDHHFKVLYRSGLSPFGAKYSKITRDEYLAILAMEAL